MVNDDKLMKSNIRKNIRYTKNLNDNKFLVRCTITNNMKGLENDPVFQRMHECYFKTLEFNKKYGPTYGGYAKFMFVNYKVNGYKLGIMLRRMNEETYNYLLEHCADDIVTHLIKEYEIKHKERC